TGVQRRTHLRGQICGRKEILDADRHAMERRVVLVTAASVAGSGQTQGALGIEGHPGLDLGFARLDAPNTSLGVSARAQLPRTNRGSGFARTQEIVAIDVAHWRRLSHTSVLTRCGGRCPVRAATRFFAAVMLIATRVALVARAICGVCTTCFHSLN